MRARLAMIALALWAAGCSAVLPLGDEYTFGDGVDAGSGMDGAVDAQVDRDGGGTDAGPICDMVPTMEEACADRCGDLELCDTMFSCGGCDGELTCGGAGTANQCGCETPPCALTSLSFGDMAEQRVTGIAVDFEGNVIVVGNFRGTITIGSDTHVNDGMRWNDMFVAKLDPAGQVLWSRSYGGLNDGPTDDDDHTISDVAVDGAGNVIFCGEANGAIDFGGGTLNPTYDMVLVKLDPDGNHVFSDTYGTSSGSDAVGVATDPASGDILLTGNFWETLTFPGLSSMTALGTQAYFDVFVARFSPDGTPRRAKRFGDGSDQYPESIAASGNSTYLAVPFNGEFDFGFPSPITLSTTTWYSLALARLSTSTFTHQWSRQLGTEVNGARIAVDVSDNLFVSGSFGGTIDLESPPLDSANGDTFLAQLDSNGMTVWARQYENILIEDLAVGADGSLYLAGYLRGGPVDFGDGPIGSDNGSRNALIAHLAADGTPIWTRVFEAPVGDQWGVGIGEGPSGQAWVGYRFEGQADLGLGELRTQGGNDVAVLQYVP